MHYIKRTVKNIRNIHISRISLLVLFFACIIGMCVKSFDIGIFFWGGFPSCRRILLNCDLSSTTGTLNYKTQI